MPAQAYIKILLAPAWDHNWPDGPASWLDNVQTGSAPYDNSAPHWQNQTGRRYVVGDKYYRNSIRPDECAGVSTEDAELESWWPMKNFIGVSSSVFTYDADPRVFNSAGNLQNPTTSTGSGGFGGVANETLYTKNRFRNTGLPLSAFSLNENVGIDIQLQAI